MSPKPTAGETAPVIVVAGPTASGKSALALALARRLGGVVINADALQVYRDLRIVTARPTPEDEALAPHRLYGILDASEVCSAGRWRTLALAEIARARAAGLRPIVVGGTGLYVEALVRGLADIPPVPAAIRAGVRARLADLGPATLHAALAADDPETAATLRPSDPQRLARAWEVLEATGRPLAAWWAEAKAAVTERFDIVALEPPREALYATCDTRFAAMVAAGALAEVRALVARSLPPDAPALKAVGVAELARHIAGRCDLPEAVAAARQATRRLAKRQLTWFRHRLPREGETAIRLSLKYSVVDSDEIFSKIS
ncbi:MAG: tRNA (adenosine(37)-N6)-dimethylallyltransferase MiaA [Alphaproteobacteria bacterium]